MRNRCFSPSDDPYIPYSRPSISSKLKAVSSMDKLPTPQLYGIDKKKKIGNNCYIFEKQIGSGYSSKVYRARKVSENSIDNKNKLDQCQQLYFAIKVIDLKKYSLSNLEMLDNEITILKKLDHPNIIKCYEIVKTHYHCYFVTEYCQGGDLLSLMTCKIKFTEQQAYDILIHIIEGYKYLISQGVLHRDLKPANILKTKDGWKIADFGFSIQSIQEIKTRYNVGTPLYMPPEALIKNLYSSQSDIFSIGIILYELLFGATPWQCKSQKELIKKISSLPFKIPNKINIKTSTKDLLTKLCAPERSKRMQKQQFLILDVKSTIKNENKQSLNPESYFSSIQKSTQRFNRYKSNENLLKAIELLNHQSKSTQDEQKSKQTNRGLIEEQTNLKSSEPIKKIICNKYQAKNNYILISQLHYCRFLYYLIKNSDCLSVEERNKTKLNIVLFKQLLKIVRHLADIKTNWFKLENWETYKHSKKYTSTLQTIKQYSARYEKQYLAFLKSISDVNIIKETNQTLQPLNTIQAFTIDLFDKITIFIAPIIRECNHNLTQIISKNQYNINESINSNITGLKALSKYKELVQLSKRKFEDFQHFQKFSNIKVITDFRSIPITTLQDFMGLRKQLKFI